MTNADHWQKQSMACYKENMVSAVYETLELMKHWYGTQASYKWLAKYFSSLAINQRKVTLYVVLFDQMYISAIGHIDCIIAWCMEVLLFTCTKHQVLQFCDSSFDHAWMTVWSSGPCTQWIILQQVVLLKALFSLFFFAVWQGSLSHETLTWENKITHYLKKRISATQ